MKIKNAICTAAAQLVKKAAVNASNSVSLGGYHQPKEPEAVRKLRKSLSMDKIY